MRIVRVRSKVLYFAAAFAISYPVDAILDRFTPVEASVLLNAAIGAAVYVAASRSFRGAGEPVEPPRPWWRMTARPKGSLVLAILCAAAVAVSFLPLGVAVGVVQVVANITLWSMFAGLFFNSWLRLRRDKPAGWVKPSSAEWRPAPRPRALR